MTTEYERHVIQTEDQHTEEGPMRTSILNTYNPRLMFDHTPLSDKKVIHCSGSHFNGIFFLYTHSKTSPDTETQMITLSEGPKDAHREIVQDFENLYSSLLDQNILTHVSLPDTSENDTYVWTVRFNTR